MSILSDVAPPRASTTPSDRWVVVHSDFLDLSAARLAFTGVHTRAGADDLIDGFDDVVAVAAGDVPHLIDAATSTTATAPTWGVEHTPECDAAHDAAEVPRGEECPDGDCWDLPDTAPAQPPSTAPTTTVELTIDLDQCGNAGTHTPGGDLTWVTHDSEGNPLARPFFDFNGRELDVHAVNRMRAAFEAMVNHADPERVLRHVPAAAALVAHQPPRGSAADIAGRLAPSSANTLGRIADFRLARRDDGLSWDVSDDGQAAIWAPVTDSDLDDLDDLRRRGLLDDIVPTALGCQVAGVLEQGAGVKAVA